MYDQSYIILWIYHNTTNDNRCEMMELDISAKKWTRKRISTEHLFWGRMGLRRMINHFFYLAIQLPYTTTGFGCTPTMRARLHIAHVSQAALWMICKHKDISSCVKSPVLVIILQFFYFIRGNFDTTILNK